MQILAVHIDRPFLRIALIEKKRKKLELLFLKSPLFEEPEDVKQFYTPLFQGKVISALSAKHLLARALEIKTGSLRHLEQAIAFQSEATSHFPKSEALSIPYILRKDKERTDVLLFTTTQNAMKEHLALLEKFKIDPDCVTAVPMALVQYAAWKIPDLQEAFLVDLGSEEWTCVALDKGEMKKFHSVEGGTEALFTALWEDRKKSLFQKEIKGIAKQIDLLQMQPALNFYLSSKLGEMTQEFGKIIYSFFRLYGAKPIFFTGNLDAFGQLKEFLMGKIQECISPELIYDFPKEELKHAIPIGMALKEESFYPQFRKNEFFPQKIWKKAGRKFAFLLFLSLLISGSLIGASRWMIEQRKEHMVSFLHNAIDKWDPSFSKTLFLEKDSDAILRRWQRLVLLSAKESPYLAPFPKVSHILSWLYQIPLVQQEQDPIQITYFHYHLEQYPDLNAPKEPYRARVEMQFKTPSALQARKFHELLLKGDGYVDPNGDLQWEALENGYRVAFLVKKRL